MKKRKKTWTTIKGTVVRSKQVIYWNKFRDQKQKKMMIDDSQKGFFTNVASVGLIKLGWLNL
jgi:hypothetical protein